MKKRLKRLLTLGLAGIMVLSLAACQSDKKEETSSNTTEESSEEVTIKIAWWGSQTRHDQTEELLKIYTDSHPNVKFETSPSGWDGYFDKLSTQTASGSMPDIVQMDYLYLTTYAKNDSIADLQEFVDDGTIDVSNIDEKLLDTGIVDGELNAMVLASSMLSVGYNPEVLAEAGVEEPTSDWTWSDFVIMCETIQEQTGKYGASMDTAADTNLFNYWVRQQGSSLFSEDDKSLGYDDDKICEDFLTMWKDLMDKKALPNPDEYAQIETLGQEASPVVTNEAGMIYEWNNYATKISEVNDTIKMVTPPLTDDTGESGLWLKPGMFFSVAETSNVKKEAAEFINWFINSEEANEIMMGERGIPVSSEIRQSMVDSGNMTTQQIEMFENVDAAEDLIGETPDPDPIGMSEVNEAFANAANSVYYGKTDAAEAAKTFREEANAILERNN